MYDIVLKIESDAAQEINSTVTEEIRGLDRIHSTMTLACSEGEGSLFPPGPDRPADPAPGRPASQAYVVIHCDQGEEYGVLRKLGHVGGVTEGDVVFGFYDVICKIEAPGHAGLERIITRGIRGIGHLRTTMTLNVISEQG